MALLRGGAAVDCRISGLEGEGCCGDEWERGADGEEEGLDLHFWGEV